eukprot:949378-Prymnesium_polylepis.1
MRVLALLLLPIVGVSAIADTSLTCWDEGANGPLVDLLFGSASLGVSNLGGLGGYDSSLPNCGANPNPTHGKHCFGYYAPGTDMIIEFNNLIPTLWEGQPVMMRITNISQYTPWNIGYNRINEEFGVINVMGGSGVALEITLHLQNDGSPVFLPAFAITFYDFDMGAGTGTNERSIEYVTACQQSYVLTSQDLFGLTPSIELFEQTRGPFVITNVPIGDPNVNSQTVGDATYDQSVWTGTPAINCTTARALYIGIDEDNPTVA